MKILILSEFIENDTDSNCYRIRYLCAQKMAEHGHDVCFMSPRGGRGIYNQETIKNLLTIKTPGILPDRWRSGGFGLLDLLKKQFIAIRHDFDIIYATNAHRPAHFFPCISGKLFRKSVIVDEAWEWLGKGGYADIREGAVGNIVGLYDRLFEISFKKYFDLVIAISSALKKRFNHTRVIVLPGGAENNNLVPYQLLLARKKTGLNPDSFIIGMSNLIRSDHADNKIFLKAFTKLIKKHKHLHLVATGPDQNYIDEVAGYFGIEDRVITPGWVEFSVYNEYLSSCDMFVLPFSATNINLGRWPNKLSDYFCLNRPVLSNPTGDVGLLFKKYRVGFLCDATTESFYNLLDQLLGRKETLGEHSRDSRYLAEQVLSFDARIKIILENFTTLIQKSDRKTMI